DSGQPIDAFLVGERLEEADQQVPLAQLRRLVGGRLLNLDDALCLAEYAVDEARARLGVGAVSEPGPLPRPPFHEHVESGAGQTGDDFRDERHAPLARRGLLRNADAHADGNSMPAHRTPGEGRSGAGRREVSRAMTTLVALSQAIEARDPHSSGHAV